MVNSQIIKVLRGPKGSVVNPKGKARVELIDFTLTRDDIPVYSVDRNIYGRPVDGLHTHHPLPRTPGRSAPRHGETARPGMKNLILDLSGNGGGYLGAAFRLAGEFLPKGTPVVSTMGRRSRQAGVQDETAARSSTAG